MERLKVLSAALALREFTVDEVATLSGVKPKTVRSVLGRNLDVVQRLESTSQGLRGRPSRRWAVIDSDAARDLSAELRGLTADIETHAPPSFGQTDADRRDVAVTVAENALADIVDEHDPSLQHEIAATARTALMMADDEPVDAGADDQQPPLHWWYDDDSSEAVRARAIDALATLTSAGRSGGITEGQLATTARAVADAMAIDRSGGDAKYFAPFAHLLASRDTFAPLLTFTAPDEEAPTTLIGSRWKTLSPSSKNMPFALVTQRWAEPLAAVSAAMPVVFVTHHPSSGALVAALLEQTRATSRPAIVMSGASARELTRESARAGASFVPINCRRPTRSDRALAIEAVTAAIDRFTAPASSADVLLMHHTPGERSGGADVLAATRHRLAVRDRSVALTGLSGNAFRDLADLFAIYGSAPTTAPAELAVSTGAVAVSHDKVVVVHVTKGYRPPVRDIKGEHGAGKVVGVSLSYGGEAKTLIVPTPAHRDDRRPAVMDVAEGDSIIYDKYGGTEIRYSGEEYLILSARDVIEVVKDK